MSDIQYVIGIDPGLASLGWGVLAIESIPVGMRTKGESQVVHHVGHGVIETLPSEALHNRLLHIEQSIDAIFSRYTIQVLTYEQQFFVKNVTSGLQVASALGVVLLYAAKQGLQITSFTPNEIKLQITGSARAKKSTVEQFICRFLGLDNIAIHHASDALGAALSYFYQSQSRISKLRMK